MFWEKLLLILLVWLLCDFLPPFKKQQKKTPLPPLIHNSLLTVWSYFSFKSDHHKRARFSWSLSNEEILTPQLQDDGAILSFACC